MKRSAWWFGLAMLAVTALANGQMPMYQPAFPEETSEKALKVGADLEFSGTGGYSIDNAAGTVRMYFDRLNNFSATTASGSIKIRLFVTQTPLVPGQGYSFWQVGAFLMNPLPTLSYYEDVDFTVMRNSVPDGVYYIHLGVLELTNSCGSSDGYCLHDWYSFDNIVQVIGNNFSDYAPPTATTTAVEYFHAGFGHYFTTAQADEITGLDGGAYGGAWVRTGYTFGVWTSGAGLYDVCRFFQVYFAPRSSHFYTPLDYECAGLIASSFVWGFEKIAYKVKLPSGGVCPAGSIKLYRLYNNGMSGAPNHRYTTSLTVRSQMIAAGWTPEDSNTACVPY
jgi:hypothetical protein